MGEATQTGRDLANCMLGTSIRPGKAGIHEGSQEEVHVKHSGCSPGFHTVIDLDLSMLLYPDKNFAHLFIFLNKHQLFFSFALHDLLNVNFTLYAQKIDITRNRKGIGFYAIIGVPMETDQQPIPQKLLLGKPD